MEAGFRRLVNIFTGPPHIFTGLLHIFTELLHMFAGALNGRVIFFEQPGWRVHPIFQPGLFSDD